MRSAIVSRSSWLNTDAMYIMARPMGPVSYTHLDVYKRQDLDELCSTLSSLENAVAVLGSVFPLERGKTKLGKQAQDVYKRQTPNHAFSRSVSKSSRSGRLVINRN